MQLEKAYLARTDVDLTLPCRPADAAGLLRPLSKGGTAHDRPLNPIVYGLRSTLTKSHGSSLPVVGASCMSCPFFMSLNEPHGVVLFVCAYANDPKFSMYEARVA